jgi:hypothetical protein
MTDEQVAQYAAATERALVERFGDLDGDYTLPHAFGARAFLPPEG